MNFQNIKIIVNGLGVARRPLAVGFGKQLEILNFDVDALSIAELQTGYDRTFDTAAIELNQAARLCYRLDTVEPKACKVEIVAR